MLVISCMLEGCTMYYGIHDIILLAIVAMNKEGIVAIVLGIFKFYFETSSIFVVKREG